jgi:hypothetical protein
MTRSRLCIALVLTTAVLLFTGTALAGTILINFETVPPEPTGPSLFADAGPSETIVVPGVATFTGGVILGNETNLPAQSFGTPPNVYGTAGFGDNLSSTLTIAFNSAFGNVDEVSFPLFNGSTSTESYVVDAFDGVTMVGSQTLSNVASNGSSGFGIINLTAATITQVTIAPTALNASCCSGWDFSIDSVAVNESVQQAFVPEPGTFLTLVPAVIGIWAWRRRTRKN